MSEKLKIITLKSCYQERNSHKRAMVQSKEGFKVELKKVQNMKE